MTLKVGCHAVGITGNKNETGTKCRFHLIGRYRTLKRKFSVGIELPQDNDTAFGIYVPAFDLPGYSCCSASDEQTLIPEIAADAILSIAQIMVTDGHDVLNIEDAGIELYSLNQDYAHCERWLTVIVDL
ncbi:hypothetical protein R1N_23650 [Enterobacter asburiae]|nr:hypothetical protein EAA2563_22750 [Enterobacter asburiae]BBZ87675.1 hypothetical protein EAA2563_22900 [Enterobacter asburiae]BCP70165.1 hypothetical protein R1N_23520 [Enterobacter asburiae]BCP70178.1 hypothetical protein R1N_23650 [Enterobacter asburiae]